MSIHWGNNILMKKINDTIYQLTMPTPFAVGDVHAYLIKGDVLSIVDTGVKTKDAWEALLFQLKEIGYMPHDIEQIILTHHHPDHIGFIEEFPRAERIIAHENVNYFLTKDTGYFQNDMDYFNKFLQMAGVPDGFPSTMERLHSTYNYAGRGEVTHPITEDMTLPGHLDWSVVETKGHAQSHLSFLHNRDRLFIGGDHLLEHISPNPILESPLNQQHDRPKPLLQFRSNLQKCRELDIKTVLPGHGNVFENVEKVIAGYLSSQEKRSAKVFRLLELETLTPFEICKKLFPKQFKTELGLTMSETIGQLDYLESIGRVQMEMKEGIHYYKVRV